MITSAYRPLWSVAQFGSASRSLRSRLICASVTAGGLISSVTPTGRSSDTTLITKLPTNQLAHSRSTADAGDQSPASGLVHHTGRLSMAWNKVTNDTVALLSAEAGRRPYDRRHSDLIASCPPEATNSCPVGRLRRPDRQHRRRAHPPPGRRRPRPVVRVVPIGGRSQPDAPHLHRRAWVAPRSTTRVSWPAGPRPPTASSRPRRLIPRSRLNRSGGLTDTGNN
jgi:hypothetical protein